MGLGSSRKSLAPKKNPGSSKDAFGVQRGINALIWTLVKEKPPSPSLEQARSFIKQNKKN